jgi:glucose/arabinose dehydrogenase
VTLTSTPPGSTSSPVPGVPPPAPTAAGPAQPTPGSLRPGVEVVATGLQAPWSLDFAPDGRIFVTERPGRVRVIAGGRLQPEPWATVPVAERPGSESGLMGIALDPDFWSNGFVYVYYSYQDQGRLWNRLVRLVDRNGRGEVDRVLLDRIPGASIHDGGRVKFGPDGKLYLTVGDAAAGENAQNPNSLNGKILRLNPDGTVPPDNPFPGSPVYALGLRNPQGLAWHPLTRQLFASDHGPSGGPPNCCHDELNLIEPGGNYGWPVVFGAGGAPRFTDPVLESGTETWAPSGIDFGTAGPVRGVLFIAALRGQHLRAVWLGLPDFRRVQAQQVLFQNEYGRLRDVVAGPDGALYILTSNRDGRGSPRPGDDKLLRVTFGP